MKKIIIILSAIVLGLSIWVGLNERHIHTLKTTITTQQQTIDSLLQLKPTLEVHLAVTDRSTLKVNAAKNSGSVIVPSEKHYVVEIDSVSIKQWK